MHSKHILFAVAAAIAGPAKAQFLNFISSPAAFGTEVAILSDYDGGGRRDILVTAPGFGSDPSGSLHIVSTEGGSNPATILASFTASQFTVPDMPNNGGGFGSAAVNLGDINGIPGDEFAVSAPNLTNLPGQRGEVYVFTIATSGSTQFASLLRVIGGNPTFGTSLARLPGNLLAVGEPATNRVLIFNPQTGQQQGALNVMTSTGTLGGNLGKSMTTVGNLLAVGAPDYRPVTAGIGPARGYVAIYDLNSTSAFPRSFLYRDVDGEELGLGVATVGQLPGGSALEDFAVMGRDPVSGFGRVLLFNTPGGFMTVPTPTVASATILVGNAPITARGRIAALGDVDGDGVGDVAASAGGVLEVFSTRLNQLASIAQPQPHSQSGALASGPDVTQIGGIDLVTGSPNLTSTSGSVIVRPLAESIRLPNPTPVSLTPTGNMRPFLPGSSGSYSLDLSGLAGQAAFLLVDVAPATPAPFNGGPALTFVNLSNAQVIGVGTSPMTFPVNMPTTLQFLFQGFVFQGATMDNNNNITPSNGILARLGTQ